MINVKNKKFIDTVDLPLGVFIISDRFQYVHIQILLVDNEN